MRSGGDGPRLVIVPALFGFGGLLNTKHVHINVNNE